MKRVYTNEDLIYLVSQQLVIDISGDGSFVDGECLHGSLHTVEGSRFPNEVHDEVVSAFDGSPSRALQLNSNLVEGNNSGRRYLKQIQSHECHHVSNIVVTPIAPFNVISDQLSSTHKSIDNHVD